MSRARIYAPVIVLLGWASVFAFVRGTLLIALAVLSTLAAVAIHIREVQ